ncbi:MAG: ATP-dependent DNA helicase RecG [Planctomycetota bacterium]|nr:ATP-dependent DNA helicase RecG [Planctomycetota bacterium]
MGVESNSGSEFREDQHAGQMSADDGPATKSDRDHGEPRESAEGPDDLKTEVQFLRGVGPRRAEMLQRMGLRTVRDLIFFFPRDYQTLAAVTPIDSLLESESASVHGELESVSSRRTRRGMHLVTARLSTHEGEVKVAWFNQPFLANRLHNGMRVVLSGKPKNRDGQWEFSNPKWMVLREDEAVPSGQILPVYRLTEGMPPQQMRSIVASALGNFLPSVEEVLPESFRRDHQLISIHEALKGIHAPESEPQLEEARRRLVFQELLVLQLALAMRRENLQAKSRAPRLTSNAKIDARICRLFPFDLTEAQRRAIDEICVDLGREVPMNRLLQGDVGAGKTVVAFYAMLLAVAHQHQAVLMAPTEILAEQHFKNLQRLLSHSHVSVGQLTGRLKQRERTDLLEQLESGDIDILVGTQAILQPGVRFQALAIVVIDEQHKFGVKQRAVLREAGEDPHYLVMTATPIPRTMTMTAFGDLDVSTLEGRPPNRQTIHSYLGEEDSRDSWWDFFRKKLDEGRQGYVVTPLVEEIDDSQEASVKSVFENLCNEALSGYRVGLLHGRQTPEEKADAMFQFSTGELQVLVATSVLEVGIDVPNATLMTIESGERFGLSQLHQLRGRISRGTHPGFVCVFADPKGDQGRERLEAFVKSNDGFELAELDFSFRGPGNMLGTRQHGMPPLRVADLLRDRDVVLEARQAAQSLIGQESQWLDPQFEPLRKQVLRRYESVLDLGDVG